MRLKGIWLALARSFRSPPAIAARPRRRKRRRSKASNPEFGARWQYPRERITKDGKRVIVYAPQIRTWDKFEHFTAQVAVEFPERRRERALRRHRPVRRHHRRSQGAAREGAAPEGRSRDVFGRRRMRRNTRSASAPRSRASRSKCRSTSSSITWRTACWRSPPPAGFNDEPPPIYVVESPAFLLFVNGKAGRDRDRRNRARVDLEREFPGHFATRRAARITC